MKAEQIKKEAERILLSDADLLCDDSSQRRAYFQGARQMAHVFDMVDFANTEQSKYLYEVANKKVANLLAKL